jgi:3-mercaptopyruvate sulfurtransferase SseA
MRFILSFALISAMSFALQTCEKSSSKTTTQKEVSKNTNVSRNTNTTATAATPTPEFHKDETPRINLADAKADFDAGRAVFVDTRAADAFNMEHIKGAINIPLMEVDARMNEIPTDKKIIAYCS